MNDNEFDDDAAFEEEQTNMRLSVARAEAANMTTNHFKIWMPPLRAPAWNESVEVEIIPERFGRLERFMVSGNPSDYELESVRIGAVELATEKPLPAFIFSAFACPPCELSHIYGPGVVLRVRARARVPAIMWPVFRWRWPSSWARVLWFYLRPWNAWRLIREQRATRARAPERLLASFLVTEGPGA